MVRSNSISARDNASQLQLQPLNDLNREDYPNYYDSLSIIFSKLKQKPRVVEEHDSFSGQI